MNSFKKSVCKHLKLVRAEVAFVAAIRIPRKQLVFQLTSEALPLLRHCTGWRKEWLFSLHVSGVQVSGEDEISVQELKISQLRLQEDPGTSCHISKIGLKQRLSRALSLTVYGLHGIIPKTSSAKI